ISQVAELAGVPIWAGGPHTRQIGLDLANQREFGHYNPDFVRKIPGFAIPGAKDPKFRELTRPTYDRILRERARIAYIVHKKLVTDRVAADAEQQAYEANMKSEAPDPRFYERWYDFVETTDGNVAKTIVAWWLRRRMDGTETQ